MPDADNWKPEFVSRGRFFGFRCTCRNIINLMYRKKPERPLAAPFKAARTCPVCQRKWTITGEVSLTDEARKKPPAERSIQDLTTLYKFTSFVRIPVRGERE